MTPTHLSMSHEGKEILRRIVEGLEGVTPGPFYAAGGYLTRRDPNKASFSRSIYHLDEMARDGFDAPYQAVPFARSEDAVHFSRCHPDAILAIAEYVAAVEKERDSLRAALEPFANAIFNDNGDITVDLSFAKADDFIKAYFVHRRTGAALKGDAK